MKITAISLLVNISLNYFLISPSRVLFLGPLRFHIWGGGLGVTGAAVATALAYVLNGVLMFAALRRSPYFRICGEGLRPCRPVIAECLGVGLPAAGQRFIIYVGHMLFTAMVARLGTLAVAIHSIALTAEEAFYIPGYGMQAAAATLAGNAAGRQNLEQLRQVARTTTLLSTVIMTALSLLLFLFPEHVMALFTTDPRVIEGGGRVLRIVSVSEPLFAVAVIMEGIFDGIGDVKAPFLISTLSLWAVRLVPTWLCVTRFGLGLEVVWICMVGDNVLRCLLLLGRFFGRNWKAYLEKKLVRPGDRDGQRS